MPRLTPFSRFSLWKPLSSESCSIEGCYLDCADQHLYREEPDSGLLITFVQFVATALFSWPSHFSVSRPPFFVKDRAVPLTRWLPNIVMFFTVNMLNNFAFGYNISVPVHIILRSGGSVMTMGVGYLWGKRYSKVQGMTICFSNMPHSNDLADCGQSSVWQCSPLGSSWQQWEMPKRRYYSQQYSRLSKKC